MKQKGKVVAEKFWHIFVYTEGQKYQTQNFLYISMA